MRFSWRQSAFSECPVFPSESRESHFGSLRERGREAGREREEGERGREEGERGREAGREAGREREGGQGERGSEREGGRESEGQTFSERGLFSRENGEPPATDLRGTCEGTDSDEERLLFKDLQ